ncbi:MAG: CDP-alcohol phosphatidyltransferase family protein [Deltaproteobacteria bacterium]|nr:MAG: CDP-alcohol phosphatidyltransferase family protein [Deltaproteobacteria bacterium]
MSDVRVVNPANAVTIARALTLFPIAYFIHTGQRAPAFVLLIVAGFADLIDGWVARAFDCQSPLGEVLDAAADGVLYGSLLLLVAYYGWAPRGPVAVIVVVGLVNMVNRVLYARRVGRTTNFRSIAMERLTGYLAFLIGFAIADYETEFYFSVCAALMTITVVHDAKRMLVDPVPA